MKILWALDPFSALPKAHAAAFAYIKLLEKSPGNISVAYVASPAEVNLSAAFDRSPAERYMAYPMQLVKKALKLAKINIPPKNIKILPEMRLSQTAAVDRLVTYAEDQKSECIVLNTHSRKGLARLVLGSYAESLIHRSSIPLLVLNPSAKARTSMKTILYASDFEKDNDPGLEEAIRLSKDVGAKLVVLHCAGPMYEWPDSGREPAIAKYKFGVNKRALAAARIARLAGIDSEILLDAKLEETSKSILRYAASKKVDLIVIKAKVGRFQALLGGSTTRKVLRAATTPVLVMKAKK